jgi:predicted nucleic acid-binding protein
LAISVIDTSVVLASYLLSRIRLRYWLFRQTIRAGAVKMVTPTLTHYEVFNALSRAVRGLKKGQKISRDEALVILSAMAHLKLEE